MATHSSIVTWKIPWKEESDRLQSMGLQRVRHNRATNTFTSLSHFHTEFQLGKMQNHCHLVINYETCIEAKNKAQTEETNQSMKIHA